MKRFDAVLAATAAVVLVVEVFVDHLHPAVPCALLMAVAGGSLAWRRVYPVVVGAIVAGAWVTAAAVGFSFHTAVIPFVVALIASWSIGAYESRGRAVLGLVLLVCGIWLAMGVDVLRGTDRYQVGDVPWVGMLLLVPGVLGIVFGRRTRSLRQAEARARTLELERNEAIAEERTRIARELHDVLAHSVAVMTVQAGAAEEMLRVDPARALEPVRAVQETGRQALVEMKRLIGMLRADDVELGLAPQPGLAEVERLVAQMQEAGLRVKLMVEGTPRAVPIGIDLSAYRVVQEALTNSLKHAGGAEASVTLRYGRTGLEVEVVDDGHGTGAGDAGHGLVGMRERVGLFGGTFEAGPREDGGFAVRALLPLEGGV